ncbi:MAG: hypothetical protein M1476_04655 [Candidatus Thermoplasmatota archaeon]|nr:hypothetical protein [Candidatus Thermoplasmatota archaeon]
MLSNEDAGIISRLLDWSKELVDGYYRQNETFELESFLRYNFIETALKAIMITKEEEFSENELKEIRQIISKRQVELNDIYRVISDEVDDLVDKETMNRFKSEIAKFKSNEYAQAKFAGESEGWSKGVLEGKRIGASISNLDLTNIIMTSIQDDCDLGDAYYNGVDREHFHIACKVCLSPMHLDCEDDNWDKMRNVIGKAILSKWSDTEIHNRFIDLHRSADNYNTSGYWEHPTKMLLNKLGVEHEHFDVLCPECHKFIHFYEEKEGWSEVKSLLVEAFKDWGHASCLESLGTVI